eukprot:TRINITY_DN2704_c0_g1_i2.p1 TRINITY_DN2704_c0_g1~~TRINITY_DN2704_c0_g1_i2.p1  ORF type:complete len:142 (-),score=40.44 TRINITY_DN2704_c0_g1_i2:118-543(-)
MPFPNLKKLARKVLVQPCSASACERNWSLFGHVQDRKRHNLTSERLQDLVYINYNIRLHEKSILGKSAAIVQLDAIHLVPPVAPDDDSPLYIEGQQAITPTDPMHDEEAGTSKSTSAGLVVSDDEEEEDIEDEDSDDTYSE